jgi:hypothetical protein
MRKVFSCRSATLLAAALAALMATGAAAAQAAPVPCNTRPGNTLQENEHVRVFTIGVRTYACAEPKGPAHPLFDTRASSSHVSTITLEDRFLAWKRFSVDEPDNRFEDALVLLDVASGASRTVAAVLGQTHTQPSVTLGDFGLDSRGTLVWIVSSASCGQTCNTTSKLSESRLGHANSVLAQDTNTGPANEPRPHAPFRALGLSRSGPVVYWLTNGQPSSHDIP